MCKTAILPDIEAQLKACGKLGRGLYAIVDVNYLSQLAHVLTILSSDLPISDEERQGMKVVVRDIVDVILEDNEDKVVVDSVRQS